MTYLGLSLKVVLRDWELEGSGELFDQARSGGTVEGGHVFGAGGRNDIEFQRSWTCLEACHRGLSQ